MVIVFFGTPQFAVPTLKTLIDSRHTVAGVVTQPDRPRGRGHRVTQAPVKMLAQSAGIPVIQPERLKDPAVEATLRGWAPDLGVVAAYGRILPEHLIAIPRFGMINVHASLLPKYRGAAPVHRAVMAGDRETGVTIMRVVKALDAGSMFAHATRPIGLEETSDVVESGLADIGATLLLHVVDQIEDGTAREDPQDDRAATYAPRITRDDGLIDWSLPAATIRNRVRGLYPWPHAYTFLDHARLLVLRARVEREPSEVSPGTVIEVTRDAIVVATGDRGRLALTTIQAEGRRPMSTREYVAGHPIRPGVVFANA